MRMWIVLLSLCVVLGLVQLGPGETLQAGESLQKAIDAASPGSTLELGEGKWKGNLHITKTIVLKGAGAGKTVIQGTIPGYPVIAISGDANVSVKLIGLTIAGANGEECADRLKRFCPYGILVQGDVRVEVINCEVVDNARSGLFAEGQAEVTVARSSFSRNGQAGIWAYGKASLNVITSKIKKNYYGLIAAAWSTATVRGTDIADNEKDGVLIAEGARVYLWGNRISGNGRVGLCVDIPGCYRTSRSFTGIVRGQSNVIPWKGEEANRSGPYCPKGLAPLVTGFGGIYPPPSDKLFAGFPSEGLPNAPLALVEFSDFSCPYCRRFALEVLPKLREEYIDTGKMRLFFLPFPVHGEAAWKEAEAALCAADQGLFWAFHDAMFAYARDKGLPPKFDPELTASIFASVGGDPDELKECLSSGTHSADVERIKQIAHELGVHGTPTFFLGGWTIPGAYPLRVFQTFIDNALAELESKG